MSADGGPPTATEQTAKALAGGALAGEGLTAEALAATVRALDQALDTNAGTPQTLGDPRVPDCIRRWVAIAKGVEDDVLDVALAEAVSRLAADPPGRARLLAVGLMPEAPIQIGLIAGYVRLFRRMQRIIRDGGMEDADLMAETRADMRRLNSRLSEALTVIHDQNKTILGLQDQLVKRERRLARANVDIAKAQEDLRLAQRALANVESERDDARRTAATLIAEQDGLRQQVKRARAGVEDLKARYLEKFALALQDLNQARALLVNDPGSTLAASKATVAQGFYMVLEDMGAEAEAQMLMARFLKDGM